jgi:hypothetical protein
MMVFGEKINFVIFVSFSSLSLLYGNTMSFCVRSKSQVFSCRFKCPIAPAASAVI